MDKLKDPIAVELGRRGGRARAESLNPKQIKAIAIKASKAAAKKRTMEAKKRKKAKVAQ
jgi:hypothetical protein